MKKYIYPLVEFTVINSLDIITLSGEGAPQFVVGDKVVDDIFN